MKSILSASLCTAALAFALPAMAQTDAGTSKTKPMHHMRHHSSRMDHMQGPKTHSKRAGDPSTDELNAKSLAAARGGSAPSAGDSSTPASAPSSTSTAPGTGMSAPSSMPPAGSAPSSGSTGTTTPTNTPGG